ncbi:unnamed protein product [Moneuplotes crassus]|uniref:Uncharacterized protein n=1 Tax=Euplotes crassus TaxID=5936 RepID=A0AAD1U2C5_EUPCR|nr:unnamed protein product [Moneuplotes crassus]
MIFSCPRIRNLKKITPNKSRKGVNQGHILQYIHQDIEMCNQYQIRCDDICSAKKSLSLSSFKTLLAVRNPSKAEEGIVKTILILVETYGKPLKVATYTWTCIVAALSCKLSKVYSMIMKMQILMEKSPLGDKEFQQIQSHIECIPGVKYTINDEKTIKVYKYIHSLYLFAKFLCKVIDKVYSPIDPSFFEATTTSTQIISKAMHKNTSPECEGSRSNKTIDLKISPDIQSQTIINLIDEQESEKKQETEGTKITSEKCIDKKLSLFYPKATLPSREFNQEEYDRKFSSTLKRINFESKHTKKQGNIAKKPNEFYPKLPQPLDLDCVSHEISKARSSLATLQKMKADLNSSSTKKLENFQKSSSVDWTKVKKILQKVPTEILLKISAPKNVCRVTQACSVPTAKLLLSKQQYQIVQAPVEGTKIHNGDDTGVSKSNYKDLTQEHEKKYKRTKDQKTEDSVREDTYGDVHSLCHKYVFSKLKSQQRDFITLLYDKKIFSKFICMIELELTERDKKNKVKEFRKF